MLVVITKRPLWNVHNLIAKLIQLLNQTKVN